MRTFRQILLASILSWLPLAVLAVLLCGLVYTSVQQNYRSNANDPQLQMAIDARTALTGGASPTQLVPATTVDMASSLAPYLIIYDTAGKPLASSVTLDGQTPTPPFGVFDTARAAGSDTLTWQPQPGVRSAIVVLHYDNGYILAGRSLTAIEDRESKLFLITAFAALAALACTFIAVFITQFISARLTPR